MSPRLGLVCAIAAYAFWGVIPIYWRYLGEVSNLEVIAHRMIWCCVFAIAFILIVRQWRHFAGLWKQPKVIWYLFLAACCTSTNWAIFIWAVNVERIADVAMGYFINPLITVVFGIVIFSERLRAPQWLAVSLMALAVLYLLIVHGQFPIVSLSLAFTFACYGLIKKTIQIPVSHSLAIETALMLLPAVVLLMIVDSASQTSFGSDSNTSALLILAGLVTLFPLLLFTAAAKSISMNALGMTQYMGPSLQLLIAVFLYNEPFGQARAVSFGLIWCALIIYTIDQLYHQARPLDNALN